MRTDFPAVHGQAAPDPDADSGARSTGNGLVWYQPPGLGGYDNGAVGDRLRVARRSAGLTQKQLAEALGVESITVSRWERGVTSPSLPRLRRVGELTGTTVSDLVRSPDTASAQAVELAALKEELAETRAIVDRVARTLEQLARARFVRDSASGSRDS